MFLAHKGRYREKKNVDNYCDGIIIIYNAQIIPKIVYKSRDMMSRDLQS